MSYKLLSVIRMIVFIACLRIQPGVMSLSQVFVIRCRFHEQLDSEFDGVIIIQINFFSRLPEIIMILHQ